MSHWDLWARTGQQKTLVLSLSAPTSQVHTQQTLYYQLTDAMRETGWRVACRGPPYPFHSKLPWRGVAQPSLAAWNHLDLPLKLGTRLQDSKQKYQYRLHCPTNGNASAQQPVHWIWHRPSICIYTGARILRQDPTECLFQFICSSNNHISRIHGMVERLCTTYGSPLSAANTQTPSITPEIHDDSVSLPCQCWRQV